MAAYYNEFDPKAAAWLRELIKAGLIADGEVDERSIIDVQANDLTGFSQCHFFAGIGGWSAALRLAGVPDGFPVWTASLPCQPFSAAGKQLGKADERHLLPHYVELVKQCRPAIQIGEQVESAIRHGWACDLQAAMEAEDYAVGYHVLGAHSVGSFHQRQRLYWVAVANSIGRDRRRAIEQSEARSCAGSYLGYKIGSVGDSKSHDQQRDRISQPGDGQQVAAGRSGFSGWMGVANGNRWESRCESAEGSRPRGSDNSTSWVNPDWLYCRDEKWRPVESGTFPLVNGVPKGMVRGGDTGASIDPNNTPEARVMRLKGYGNAIVPQIASEFIGAFFESIGEMKWK